MDTPEDGPIGTETCCDYKENRNKYCVRWNYIVYLHLTHNMELKYKFNSSKRVAPLRKDPD
jgi:hypothetical protein